MISENIPRQISVGKYDCYPGVVEQEEDYDDTLPQSYEIHSGTLNLWFHWYVWNKNSW